MYSPTINTFETPTQGSGDGQMSFSTQIRRPVEVIGSLVAGGKHVWNRWALAYDFAVARASSEDHGYASADFAPPDGDPLNSVVFNVDTSSPLRPKLVAQGGAPIYDPAHYMQDLDIGQELQSTAQPTSGVLHTQELQLERTFLARSSSVARCGMLQVRRFARSVFNSVDNPAMTRVSGTFPFDYYDKHYTLGPQWTTTVRPTSKPCPIQVSLRGCGLQHAELLPEQHDLVERITDI